MADTLVVDTPLVVDVIDDQAAETATFTRATAATITDLEPLIKDTLSGEVRFKGARRVENLVPTSSYAWAGWTENNATKTDNGDGTVTVTDVAAYGNNIEFALFLIHAGTL